MSEGIAEVRAMEAMLDMSAAPALASKVASGISSPDMAVKGP